jgi:outer membrane protein assembly factor BamB
VALLRASSIRAATELPGYIMPRHRHVIAVPSPSRLPSAQPLWHVRIDPIVVSTPLPDRSVGVTSQDFSLRPHVFGTNRTSAVAISSDAVYAIATGRLTKRALRTGRLIWSSGASAKPPIVVDQSLVACASGHDALVLDGRTGQSRMRHQTDMERDYPFSLVDGILVTYNANGRALAWNAVSGKPLWVAPLEPYVRGPPVTMVGRVMLLQDFYGEPGIDFIHAVDITSGRELWSNSDSVILANDSGRAYLVSSDFMNLLGGSAISAVDVIDLKTGKRVAYRLYEPVLPDGSSFSGGSDNDAGDGLWLYFEMAGIIYRYPRDVEPTKELQQSLYADARLVAGPRDGRLWFTDKHGLWSVRLSDQSNVYRAGAVAAFDRFPDPFTDYPDITGEVGRVDLFGSFASASRSAQLILIDTRTARAVLRARLPNEPYAGAFDSNGVIAVVTRTGITAYAEPKK